jgi:cyclophilin family peptidyl-prolyl cis-trans isomerase
LGNSEVSCPKTQPKSDEHPPPVTSATLVVDSDVGPLTLHVDGRDAPTSAAHFLKLVASGFYANITVHAARPGFAVQFGDEDGDGYQDEATDPLPHEVSPEPFGALTFGMSAFSPGSQHSQIFVLVSDAPQLLGTRVRLGRAEGPWHLLTVGDQIYSITKKP